MRFTRVKSRFTWVYPTPWLEEADGVALAEALQSEHCRLTDLDLRCNQLGEVVGVALAVALQLERCRLTSLNFEDNDLGEANEAAIQHALSAAEV